MVLLPIAALATIIVAAVPRLRKHYAPVVFLFAFGAAGFVGLAQGSGEQLEERVIETELIERHTDQGESVLPWAFLVLAVAFGVMIAPWVSKKVTKLTPKLVTGVLVVGSLVAAAGATYTIVSVGHSGAEAVWENTPDRVTDEDGGDGYRDDDDDDGDND